MGLDVNGTKFLLYAARHGASFADTATIGRQSMLVDAQELADGFRLFGRPVSREDPKRMLATGYAEDFLTELGAQAITSFDASDYEGATVVHDLNHPIADEWKGRFTVVLDGGSLEHVFNYPQALKNCMEMVAVGGHYLAITPCNNFFGHGFYQFGPELFYRVFSEANGFRLERLMLHETAFDREWYDVGDPAVVHERVTLTNSEPAHLLVIAKRLAEVPIFAEMPQQSDYVEAWGRGSADTSLPQMTLAEKAWKKVQRSVDRRLGELHRRRRHFKRVDLP